MAAAKTPKDDHRRAALYLLQGGVCTPQEIASALGERRQTIHFWLLEAKCDWRRQRNSYIKRWITHALAQPHGGGGEQERA